MANPFTRVLICSARLPTVPLTALTAYAHHLEDDMVMHTISGGHAHHTFPPLVRVRCSDPYVNPRYRLRTRLAVVGSPFLFLISK